MLFVSIDGRILDLQLAKNQFELMHAITLIENILTNKTFKARKNIKSRAKFLRLIFNHSNKNRIYSIDPKYYIRKVIILLNKKNISIIKLYFIAIIYVIL